jgi:hypothetical protein
LDLSNSDGENEVYEDFEEFMSGEDSARGGVKTLSCIEEEEDTSERKTLLKIDNYMSGNSNNRYNQHIEG